MALIYPSMAMKYFHCPLPGNKTKRGVEFRNSTRDISKIGREVGNVGYFITKFR